MMKPKSVLIIGASRGLGLAMAQEFVKRDWHVVATFRGATKGELHTLAQESPGKLAIESVDITDVAQISALKTRLKTKMFDVLFVNAGVANSPQETVGEVATDEFTRIMVTNALSPMRVVEQLADLVKPSGTVGVMSSGLASVADNEKGGYEIYRASKAALNTLMRSYTARRTTDHSLLLLAPGWIQTDMGGANAPFTLAETIPQIVDTIAGQEGKKGLHYLDRFGKPVPLVIPGARLPHILIGPHPQALNHRAHRKGIIIPTLTKQNQKIQSTSS